MKEFPGEIALNSSENRITKRSIASGVMTKRARQQATQRVFSLLTFVIPNTINCSKLKSN